MEGSRNLGLAQAHHGSTNASTTAATATASRHQRRRNTRQSAITGRRIASSSSSFTLHRGNSAAGRRSAVDPQGRSKKTQRSSSRRSPRPLHHSLKYSDLSLSKKKSVGKISPVNSARVATKTKQVHKAEKRPKSTRIAVREQASEPLRVRRGTTHLPPHHHLGASSPLSLVHGGGASSPHTSVVKKASTAHRRPPSAAALLMRKTISALKLHAGEPHLPQHPQQTLRWGKRAKSPQTLRYTVPLKEAPTPTRPRSSHTASTNNFANVGNVTTAVTVAPSTPTGISSLNSLGSQGGPGGAPTTATTQAAASAAVAVANALELLTGSPYQPGSTPPPSAGPAATQQQLLPQRTPTSSLNITGSSSTSFCAGKKNCALKALQATSQLRTAVHSPIGHTPTHGRRTVLRSSTSTHRHKGVVPVASTLPLVGARRSVSSSRGPRTPSAPLRPGRPPSKQQLHSHACLNTLSVPLGSTGCVGVGGGGLRRIVEASPGKGAHRLSTNSANIPVPLASTDCLQSPSLLSFYTTNNYKRPRSPRHIRVVSSRSRSSGLASAALRATVRVRRPSNNNINNAQLVRTPGAGTLRSTTTAAAAAAPPAGGTISTRNNTANNAVTVASARSTLRPSAPQRNKLKGLLNTPAVRSARPYGDTMDDQQAASNARYASAAAGRAAQVRRPLGTPRATSRSPTGPAQGKRSSLSSLPPVRTLSPMARTTVPRSQHKMAVPPFPRRPSRPAAPSADAVPSRGLGRSSTLALRGGAQEPTQSSAAPSATVSAHESPVGRYTPDQLQTPSNTNAGPRSVLSVVSERSEDMSTLSHWSQLCTHPPINSTAAPPLSSIGEQRIRQANASDGAASSRKGEDAGPGMKEVAEAGVKQGGGAAPTVTTAQGPAAGAGVAVQAGTGSGMGAMAGTEMASAGSTSAWSASAGSASAGSASAIESGIVSQRSSQEERSPSLVALREAIFHSDEPFLADHPPSPSMMALNRSRASISSSASGIYHLKRVEFDGKRVPIVMQNENGPCPLIAVANTLLLRGRIVMPEMVSVVNTSQLVEYVADAVTDTVSDALVSAISDNASTEAERLDADTRANAYQNAHDAIAVLPELQHGLDVNVRFTGVRDFEPTRGCVVFDVLRIPLYHGWLVDPQCEAAARAVAGLGYNELVEQIVANKESTNERMAASAMQAEEFLASTASQLTYHGLCELNAAARDGELAVFFRNNHFSTLYKFNGRLYLLVTDQGFLHEPTVVWETLNTIDGDGMFVDGRFRQSQCESAAAPAPLSPADAAARSRQIANDEALARAVEEEERRAAALREARHRAAQQAQLAQQQTQLQQQAGYSGGITGGITDSGGGGGVRYTAGGGTLDGCPLPPTSAAAPSIVPSPSNSNQLPNRSNPGPGSNPYGHPHSSMPPRRPNN